MESPAALNLQKREIIDRLLKGDHVLIHVTPAAAGVQLPPHLSTVPWVTLKISRLFRGALEISDHGVAADLLFNGRYFSCRVPFEAIFGCSDENGRTTIWPQSAAAEILARFVSPAAEAAAPQSAPSPSRPGRRKARRQGAPHLKRVK